MNNPQIRISRKVATVPIIAGQFAYVDLPRQYDYESVFLRINGGLQVTTNCTSVRAEAPCQSLARIELVADGKNTLDSIPGHMACFGNYDRPGITAGARATTPPTAATVATYQVEAGIALDFAMPKGLEPKDSNFRTSQLSLFQLRLTFGNAIDNFVPGAGVAVYNGLNVDVFTQEVIELKGADGSFSMPIALKKRSYQEIVVSGNNNGLEVKLPAGNLITDVLTRAEGNVTAGEPSATMLNNVIAKSGEDYRLNLSAANLRMKNNLDFGQILAGYYIHNPMALGPAEEHITCGWDVAGQLEPKMVYDTLSGANFKLFVATTELILARK